MSTRTLNLNDQLYQYFQSISVREPEILQELRQETEKHPMSRMQISPEQGQFMAFLITLMNAKKVLEIGVFTGYSSLVMALALPSEGRIIACDVDEETTAIAQRYWQKAGVSAKINLKLSPALETLDQLIQQKESNTFDFVFIDADKSNYDNYYEKALQLLRKGGLIAIDNVLWGGKVADSTIQDNRTKKIRQLNEKLYHDQRIYLSLVPIGDGLTLAIKQ